MRILFLHVFPVVDFVLIFASLKFDAALNLWLFTPVQITSADHLTEGVLFLMALLHDFCLLFRLFSDNLVLSNDLLVLANFLEPVKLFFQGCLLQVRLVHFPF